MRIEEFTIRRYDPLPEFNRIRLNAFNLFFGNNEEGKTLVIDALIKLLFKKYKTFWKRIDRVEDYPEGQITIKNKGKIIKIPDKGEVILKNTEEIEEKYKEKDVEQKEEKLIETRERLKSLDKEMNRLALARNREKYERGTKALGTLEESSSELDKLGKFNNDDKDTWKTAERDSKKGKEEQKKLRKSLRNRTKKLESKTAERKSKERELSVLKNTLDKIEGITANIKIYEGKRQKFQSDIKKGEFYSKTFIISSGLLLLSVAGLFVYPGIFIYLTGLFLISALLSGWKKYQIIRDEGSLNGVFEEIKLEASKYNLQAENIEDLNHKIQKLKDEFSKEEKAKNELKETEASFKSEIIQIKKQISDWDKSIKKAEKEIERIKEKSGLKTISSYAKKLEEKEFKDKISRKQITILDNDHGTEGRNLKDRIEYWKEQIANFQKYKDKAKGIKFDEKIESKLNGEKDILHEKEKDLRNELKEFKNELGEIERDVNEVLGMESDYLYCQTLKDLRAVREKINNFLSRHKRKRNNVLRATEIFKEIQIEKEQQVSNLFGEKSPVSDYFSEITDGLYEEVSFHSGDDERRIYVTKRNGEKLSDYKLSGGAYDQLYLAIRLGLGEKLMLGEKGFFIMDDPFVKSDKGRLKKQINLLKKISELGWQIIYFTAKDEVKQLLNKDIKDNRVKFYQVPGI